MYPQINILGLNIYSYALLSVVGFIAAAVVAFLIGKRREIAVEKIFAALLVSVLGAFLGGHLLFALTNIKLIAGNIVENGFVLKDLILYINGMVFYGGLLGALLLLLVYTCADKTVDRRMIFDIFAVSVPLFHAFGRVGCFLSGCCYGVECEYGITIYTNTSAALYGVSRFPVQLSEALFNALLFVMLLYLYKKNRFYGRLIYVYLLLYAAVRFALEYLRGDKVRGFIFGLSTSQFISILIILFVIVNILVDIIKKKHNKAVSE